jgi:hypothetical protein
MPAILERLVKQLRAKGHSEQSAYAIATSTLQKSGSLKKGSQDLTDKGKKRQAMGADGRAKDRAAKESDGKYKPSDYKYSKRTNRGTLKKGSQDLTDQTSRQGSLKR